MNSHRRDTVVIGASAGGIRALRQLLAVLPSDLPASVCIVLHQARNAGGLDRVLARDSRLPVAFVEERRPLEAAHVYLAPPDRHLVIEDDHVLITNGPRENRSRPSINPLFRSAAAARGGRVIAVQLTGLLDDGVAGLDAVRRCGGLVVVQDPADAEFDEMPRRALESLDADHVTTLDALPDLLATLAGKAAGEADIPDDIAIEARLSGLDRSRPADVEEIGERVSVACPDCGGPLWQVGRGGTATFRCHVGHALSARALLGAQSEDIERSLWVAVRSLSERAAMLDRLARHDRGRSADDYRERADEAAAHSEQARRFLLSLHDPSAEHREVANDASDTGTPTPKRRVVER